jgi:hypothetical protein
LGKSDLIPGYRRYTHQSGEGRATCPSKANVWRCDCVPCGKPGERLSMKKSGWLRKGDSYV